MGDKAGSLARPSLGAAVGKVSGREMADKGQRPPHLVAHLVVHQWAPGSLQGSTFSIRSRCLFVPTKTRTLTRIGPKHCSTSWGSHVHLQGRVCGRGWARWLGLDSGSQNDGGIHSDKYVGPKPTPYTPKWGLTKNSPQNFVLLQRPPATRLKTAAAQRP